MRIPADPSNCNCKPAIETKPTDTLNDTNGEGKKKRKDPGEFKGELRPLKEGWCPTCLVEQKAKIFDQIGASNDGLGRILNQVVSRNEPQPFPRKIRQKAIMNGNDKKSESAPATTKGVKIHEDTEAKVPEWVLSWEGKTRNQIKREIRERKMEMVDEIRSLREFLAGMKVNMDELEQAIKAKTANRRAEELKMKERAEKERQEHMEVQAANIGKIRAEKMEKKAKRQCEHFAREEQRKARVLYRV